MSDPYLPSITRLLPQDSEAERCFLCALMLAPREVSTLAAERGMREEWFHLPAHTLIYSAIQGVIESGRGVDFVTISGYLRDRKQLDIAGGAAYLSEISVAIGTAMNARYHAEILGEKYILRKLIQTATEIAGAAYEDQEDAKVLLDAAEQKMMAIRQNDDAELKEVNIHNQVLEIITELETRYDNKGQLSGVSTGFQELDEMTDGLQPTDLIVIAARPSMGKTALGMNIAENVALNYQKHVAFFSLEMSGKPIIKRSLFSTARVNGHFVERGFMSNADFPKISAAGAKLSTCKHLHIIDANSATVQAVRARARRLKQKYPDLALIVIDYLQQMRSATHTAKDGREREVAQISSCCKSIAKELHLPVIVLAQLNRDVEKRGGEGRPRMSDLRESGSIEQDADLIGLLYRPEYYAEGDEAKREVEGQAFLNIGKNRNGPVGEIALTFLKEFGRFETRASAEYYEEIEKRNYHDQ